MKLHIAEFLTFFWHEGTFGEIRAYGLPKRYSTWCEPASFDSVMAAVSWSQRMNDAGWSVGFGVNPRDRRREPAGTMEEVPGYVAIPFDWDSRDQAKRGLGILRDFGFRPTILVNSGRGIHAYLRLREGNKARVRGIAKAANKACESDPVYDPARIMRLPGSVNWRVGQRAEILIYEPSIWYGLEDLECAFPVEEQGSGVETQVRGDSPVAMPEKLRAILSGEREYPSRSERTMAAAMTCALYSYSSQDAIEMLLASEHIKASIVPQVVLKAYRDMDLRMVTMVEIVRRRGTDDGSYLQLLALNGPFAGRIWWQRVGKFMEEVLASFGGGIGIQARGGVIVEKMKVWNRSVLRVKLWIPREVP